jgi:hypothetical protein
MADKPHIPTSEGWQPIETAPKDGTAIWLWADGAFLGFCEPADPPFTQKDRWFLKASFRRIDGRSDEIFGCYVHGASPTHWQPLPPPPENPDD